MTTETAVAVKPRKKTRSPKSPVALQIVDATPEDFNLVIIPGPKYRTDLKRSLDKLDVNSGIMVEGNFKAIKTSVNGFSKQAGKTFDVLETTKEGWSLVKRIETVPVTQGDASNN